MNEERENLDLAFGVPTRYMNYGRLFAWGAGATASLYFNGLERVRDDGVKIEAYIDSNPEKWGHSIGDLHVISPEEFYERYDSNCLVLVMSIQPKVIDEIGKLLDLRNIHWCSADEYILSRYRDKVMRVYDMLDDEKSKKVYANIISTRMKHKNPATDIQEKCPYFCMPEFWGWHPNEVFVDCGAYVGDSVEAFIREHNGVFGKIYAFEPDARNRRAFVARMERLKQEWNISDDKLRLIGCAVGKREQKAMAWSADEKSAGICSKLECGNETQEEGVDVVTIDSSLEGVAVSFLKADIESYEYDMLLGAEKTIRRQKPKLAICIYHNAVDLYSIPLLIKEICSEYKIAVRQHCNTQDDTVLYAWVEE